MNAYKNIFNLIKNHNYELFIEELNKLDENYDLNIRDENDIYLLEQVILINKPELVKLLLNKKCRIDIVDKDNRSILYLPIIYNYSEIIKLLLEYNKILIGKSILDIKDKSGNIPLHYAIINKNIDVIKLLLEENSSVYDTDNKGYNSLHYAIYTHSEIIVKLLINKYNNIDIFTKNGETPLHIATSLQLYNICKLLLEYNANPNSQNFENELTPLHYVSHNNNKQICNLLLEYNANLNIQDIRGNTPIHYSLIENNMDILVILLNRTNINYNLWNINGMTILHLILNKLELYYKINDISQIDLNNIIYKTNLSIQNNNGDTCLYLLIKNKLWKNYIDILEKKKLDIFVINSNDEYIIDLIDKNDFDQFINMVVNSYINSLKRSSLWKDELDLLCSYEFNDLPENLSNKFKIKNKDDLNNNCFKLIKKKIIENINNKNISHCSITSYPKSKPCLEIDEGTKLNYCTYTGSTLDILIGLIYILKKHNNACSILSHNYTKNMELCKFYKSRGIIINSKCEFLNFEILWVNYKLYINENFNILLNKCIDNNNKIFIIIPIGIELHNGGHANYLIYDIRSQEIERFEPHGSTFPFGFNYNPDLLDETLEIQFKKFNKNIKYFRPKDYIPKIGFQIMDILEEKNKKIGDPGGFCALWSLWYVDMRLLYRDVNREVLVNELIKTIKYRKISFKNLIRNYSKNIIELRDQILNKADLDINDWLNDVITNTQIDNLINEIIEIINNL